ncbi:MAG: aminopeptidase P N-terminal domain-containing protein [Gemmatimonadales bacterium]
MKRMGSWLAGLVLLTVTAAHGQIPAAEYAARRDALAAKIDSGIVIAFGGRTLVTDFSRFFQLPAFHYLTGYDEPDAAFVIVARGGHASTTLFVTRLQARTAFYYGQRADTGELARTLGVAARSASALPGMVDSLVATHLPFYSLVDFEDADFARADSLTRGQEFVKALEASHPGLTVRNAHPLVNQLRAMKSPAEIALLVKAAEISSKGHRAVLEMAEPQHEYDIQAVLESTFLRLGGERPAYGSIVGSGSDGTLLHYMLDRGPTRPGDLVVIDAATQYQGYAADVTRTIPVSGKYTAAQRQLYQLVRDAQAAAERNAKAGMSRAASVDSSVVIRAAGLARLGLVESADATYDPPVSSVGDGRRGGGAGQQPPLPTQASFWMIHGISHGLGVAVHDYVQAGPNYQVGDAFTIEPGIYISSKMLDVLPDTPRNRQFIAAVRPAVAKYDMTGVRIEDDYAITPTGLERLSTAPREIAEIEAIMAKRAKRR